MLRARASVVRPRFVLRTARCSLHPATAQCAAHHAFQGVRPFRCLRTALQLSARVESARRSGPTEQLHLRELPHGNYRRMCWPSRSDNSFARRAPESHNVPLTDIVRIHQDLGLGPATEDCVARVLRVLQDRANRAALPSVREPVTILVRPTRRGTRNTITVQPFGDRHPPRPVFKLSIRGQGPQRSGVAEDSRDVVRRSISLSSRFSG